jgi:hypothetical protein
MKMDFIQEIVSDVEPRDGDSKVKEGAPITLWISKRDKERYEMLQKATDRKVSKAFRKAVTLVLDAVEEKIQ